VVGGQLLGYNLEDLNKLSPVIEPSATPCILVLYVERGELKNYFGKCEKTINLGSQRTAFSTTIRKFLYGLVSYVV
jgi:hypothetical protein